MDTMTTADLTALTGIPLLLTQAGVSATILAFLVADLEDPAFSELMELVTQFSVRRDSIDITLNNASHLYLNGIAGWLWSMPLDDWLRARVCGQLLQLGDEVAVLDVENPELQDWEVRRRRPLWSLP
ncbi:hypothetical protein M011DRAFT_475237 [Sporormia fimetaria CBS 119925]|uniref:Uncharacterized protein n=1 Tax=Sporormia fimetaria CBS 119925 TaxID=1340428 RepID=A0A6A6VK33_9PLEO|nr:hypothetical protein M011DRAFT_475237 [Sporormia fimetaria CBS 119925]